jgi:hypothetical protein
MVEKLYNEIELAMIRGSDFKVARFSNVPIVDCPLGDEKASDDPAFRLENP